MAYLYRHIRLDNNKPFYIGVGGLMGDDMFRRAYRKTNRSSFWNNIVSKAGYEVEIMLDDISNDDILNKEKYFISLYGRINIGTGCLVNLTDGGDGCNNMKHSEKVKLMQSERVKGVKHPNHGKALPTLVRNKISNSLLGRKNNKHSSFMMKNKNSSKKVIDNSTGVLFSSTKEASDFLKMNNSTLKAMLNGYNPNKTRLSYYII